MPGPAPKKNARFGKGRSGWVTLPASGCQLPPPKWPGPGRAPKLWELLWAKPQAVMWHRLCCEEVVARYVRLRRFVDSPKSLGSVGAAHVAEVRQLEDRLGLSPMALKRLQWEIGDVDPAPSSGPAKARQSASMRDFEDL